MHPILFILLLAVGAVVAAFAAVFILVPLFKGIGWVIRQVFRFVGGEISDLLRIIGAIITIPFLSLFTVGSVIVGRWSAASHFGRSIKDELVTMGAAIYRVVLGHPARLLCLTALTDGIENRLPNAIAEAPGRDKPGRRGGQFDGYTIVGSLPGGGSGGRLYVAEPDEMKRAAFTRRGLGAVEQVVIKSFSLSDGSSLPQIIRESRSLDAARDLGLVLEHDLSPDRFYYVMEYVPGESLTRVAQRMHAISGERGLRNEDLGAALGYIADLCRTLRTYHRGGLWHKDVKPDNVIVDGNRAHLVDLGLITHMRSAMTLTTHGTEYFRDPELVRMALKGVKVNEVDGARFDVYGVGAALYSVIENSFPAHGGLSQITKRCPETIRWIIRRAMTDYDKRYASMNDLLADVEAVRTAPDPFTLRPADLPSMRGGAAPVAEPTPDVALTGDPGAAPAQPNAATPDDRHGPRAPREVFASLHQAVGAAAADLKDHVRQRAEEARRRGGGPGPRKPRVTNWWTGSFDLDPVEAVQRRGAPAPRPAAPAARVIPVDSRAPAAEQLARARARRDAIRQRAHDRMAGRHGRPAGRAGRAGGGAALRRERPKRYDNNLNAGVAVALFLFLAAAVAVGALMLLPGDRRIAGARSMVISIDGPAAAPKGPAQLAPPAPPAAPGLDESPVLPELSALVLRDPIAVMPGHSERVNDRLDRLHGAGVRLIGFGPSADEDSHTEAAASLRQAIGMAPFASADAQQRIESWLHDRDDVDMVVWIGPDADGKAPTAWMVRGPHTDAATLDRASSLIR